MPFIEYPQTGSAFWDRAHFGCGDFPRGNDNELAIAGGATYLQIAI